MHMAEKSAITRNDAASCSTTALLSTALLSIIVQMLTLFVRAPQRAAKKYKCSIIEMAGFAEWTRLKNDEVREASDSSQSTAPLKYVTYKADYLSAESCVRGKNANNCRVYGDDLQGETLPRIGSVTNKRELTREATNVRTLGIPTAPHQGNGPLLGNSQLDMLSDLNGFQQKFAKSCDVEVRGQPSTHQIDMATRINPQTVESYADRLQPREQIYMSSRVQRRNAWAGQCTPRSLEARQQGQ